MRKTNDLGRDPVFRLVCRLAIPTMLAQLVSVLYSIVDRIYIGNIQGIGDLALAGVGVCGPIVTLLSSFASLVGLGGSPIMAMRMGEGRDREAGRVLSNSFLMLLILSGVLTTLFLLLKEHLLMWFGASDATFGYANTYLTIYTAGTFFALMATGMNSFLIAQGFSGLGMATVMLGAVLNIVLDPIFIFGLDLGISGAAIATLLSQCVSASILASFFLRGQSEIRVSIRCVSTAPKIYLTIFKSGMPSFFRQGMASVSAMALNFNAGVYGDAAVAAMAIVTKVFNFLLSAVIGFGQGMQPVVGYNYGAKELGRVRQAVSFSLKFCTVILRRGRSLRRRSCSSSETTPRWWQWGHRHSDSNVSHCPWRRCWSLPICCSSLWANPGGRRCWPCAGRGCFLSPWCICCPCTLGCWVWR